MLVVYNPHVDDMLAEPPHFRMVGRRPLKKYGYVLTGIAKANCGAVPVFVDGTMSAFVPRRIFDRLPQWLREFIAQRELARWVRINKFDFSIELVADCSENSVRTLLFFTYKAAVGAFDRRRAGLMRFGIVIAHLSHFFIATREKSLNLRQLSNVVLAGDSDVTANAYFEEFFGWYAKRMLILPFTVGSRFEVRKPLSARDDRAIATGTFHDLREEVPQDRYADFINFFKLTTYHPVRKQVFARAAELSGDIDCKVSPFRPPGAKRGIVRKLLSYFSVAQKKYFAIDIVELYNGYRYAIIGEEASGFPALGAFEAMACGCVLIAQPQCYLGLALSPEIDFVAHDGSIASILSAIDALRADPDGAQRIAHAGAAFVESNFRSDVAFSALIVALSELGLAAP